MPREKNPMPNEVEAHFAESLDLIKMALQVSAKLVVPEFDQNNNITFRTVTKEEWEANTTNFSPSTLKLIPVEPSVRRDGSTPFAWVFICPPPYNGVEIACVPDGATETGIRCTASRLNVSREREKYHVVFMDDATMADWREWQNEMSVARSTE